MPRTTENVTIDGSTLRVDSTLAFGESLSLEDIGGAVLLCLSGKVAYGSGDTESDPIVSTAFDKDTWKYDIGPWLREAASSGTPEDPQSVSDEAFRILGLKASRSDELMEISKLEENRSRLSTPEGALDEGARVAMRHFEEGIERIGLDRLEADPSLKDELVREAGELEEISPEGIQRRIEELAKEIEQRRHALDSGVGELLRVFEEFGSTTVKSLLEPIAKLATWGVIEEGQSFGRLVIDSVSFNDYGPNPKKLSVNLPSRLNRLAVPISYDESIALADLSDLKAAAKGGFWAGR